MTKLTDDATEIWNAGVDAVRAKPLIKRTVESTGDCLVIDQHRWSREDFDRILVVGGGKAGTAMAEGLLEAIGDWLPVTGWINVPEGTQRSLPGIQVHPARPAGLNEPTEAGVIGTREMLHTIENAGPRDLVIALISGGGSALMPAPVEGVSLDDKVAVTRFLSGAGADITQLNAVRKHLSRTKGGGMLRACRGGHLVTLVLSDVLGDPLDLIASGPTVPDPSHVQEAIDVLEQFDTNRTLPSAIYRALEDSANQSDHRLDASTCPFTTIVIGNNALAVDEAGLRAESLGYNHTMHSAASSEGSAEEVGRHLAELTWKMLHQNKSEHRSDCLITGGEPTVQLIAKEQRGLGGRNQQLVLAAYQHLLAKGLSAEAWDKLCILSGGTDGEDGPTDAAGGVIDGRVHHRSIELGLDVDDHLRRCDAYSFLKRANGLLTTGPTGTNVCDLRVCLVNVQDDQSD